MEKNRIKKKDNKLKVRDTETIVREIKKIYNKITSPNRQKKYIYNIGLQNMETLLKIKKNKDLGNIQKQLHYQTKTFFHQFTKDRKEDFIFVMELPKEFSIGGDYFKEKLDLNFHLHIILTSNKNKEEMEKLLRNKLSDNTTLSSYTNIYIKDITKREDDINTLSNYFIKQNQFYDNKMFHYEYEITTKKSPTICGGL